MAVRFRSGEVHIWRMELMSARCAESAWPIMTDAERSRAASFRFEADRERFCQSRYLLRQVLGRYLQLDAAEVAITQGPHGKPMLQNARTPTGLQFNLTHCRSMALLAVTMGQPVGIDVEDGTRLNKADISALARDYFTTNETQAIMSVTGSERIGAFLTCWTRKEALLKAVGVGLNAHLNLFEVPLNTTGKWQVLWAPNETSSERSTFDMVDLNGGDIFAAVAASRIDEPVLIFDFHNLDTAFSPTQPINGFTEADDDIAH
jgi:4'-phosphopantetheinyl transferase